MCRWKERGNSECEIGVRRRPQIGPCQTEVFNVTTLIGTGKGSCISTRFILLLSLPVSPQTLHQQRRGQNMGEYVEDSRQLEHRFRSGVEDKGIKMLR